MRLDKKLKKKLLLNAPYVLFIYLFDKVAQGIRLAPGADASQKLLHLADGFGSAYAYYDSKGIMHPHALPYRNGLFVVREFIAPNGHRGTQMLVTPKGKQVFLAERAEIIG